MNSRYIRYNALMFVYQNYPEQLSDEGRLELMRLMADPHTFIELEEEEMTQCNGCGNPTPRHALYGSVCPTCLSMMEDAALAAAKAAGLAIERATLDAMDPGLMKDIEKYEWALAKQNLSRLMDDVSKGRNRPD